MAAAESPDRDPLSPEEVIPDLSDEDDEDKDIISDTDVDRGEENMSDMIDKPFPDDRTFPEPMSPMPWDNPSPKDIFSDVLDSKSSPYDQATPEPTSPMPWDNPSPRPVYSDIFGGKDSSEDRASPEPSSPMPWDRPSPKADSEDKRALTPIFDVDDLDDSSKDRHLLDITEKDNPDSPVNLEEPTRSSIKSPLLDDEERLSEVKSPGSEPIREEEPSPAIRERSVTNNDLRDEASSVMRELDEHELDYDEEVPEEPAVPNQEDESEKLDEDDKDKDESPVEAKDSADEQKNKDAPKDKKKDDDDGEIDEGEIDDDDLEEGEVKDPNDRKTRPRMTCRFFMKGNCTWGMSCRFIHPGMNDKGNYSLITKPDPFAANGTPAGAAPIPPNPWGAPVSEEFLPVPAPDPPTESAWERGLRHAKEVLKKATMRKEQEPDFEEKRLTVTIGEDEREFDKENDYWNYRITREVRESGEVEFRESITHGDPYSDPYYDLEMERYWRGGQYENFRVQYTEAEPYRYRDRERERDRDRQRDRDRDRDRERRQREREREREREKERQKRKDEWERDRNKRDEKERQREKEKEKEKEKKIRSPLLPSRTNDASKKDAPIAPLTGANAIPTSTPLTTGGSHSKRADEWKDPWRRSKSPKRKLGGTTSPSRGRRRRHTSASSDSGSNSSRSSSRSSSYSGSGSSRSSSYSSYSSRSSRHSSFSGSRSRSRSYSSSPSPSPTPKASTKSKSDPAPPPKGEKPPVKKAAPPPPAGAAPKPPKVLPEPPKTSENRIGRAKETKRKAPPRRRTVSGSVSGSGSSSSGSSSRSGSASSGSSSASGSPSAPRKARKSSVSSSSSSVRSADSEDMYADLASPISSASSHSPTPSQPKKEKEKGPAEKTKKEIQRPKDDRSKDDRSKEDRSKEDRSKEDRSKDDRSKDDRSKDDRSKDDRSKDDRSKEDRPKDDRSRDDRAKDDRSRDERSKDDRSKDDRSKEDRSKEDRRMREPAAQTAKPVTVKPPKPVSGTKTTLLPPPVPPPTQTGFSAHKEIKLTLLNKSSDKGSSRKRYEPSEKDRPSSPPAKKSNLSPDRAQDRKQLNKPPSPKAERQRLPNAKPSPTQPERRRPSSPPPKSSSKVTSIPGKTPDASSAAGTKPGKPSTLSRREELLKQLKAVEDAIARKRAKIPSKV